MKGILKKGITAQIIKKATKTYWSSIRKKKEEAKAKPVRNDASSSKRVRYKEQEEEVVEFEDKAEYDINSFILPEEVWLIPLI